ncbi:zinc finger protein 836-like [Aricia agestis]|uniref:zinc finger protein 836-like n=1 Tax=Aricia agestis TaxID=91739 RepID=UPI001C20BCE8|nr:zinc finger protein 836-like [Aricia agestis]
MPKCSVVGCGSRRKENQKSLSLHRLPKSEYMRKKWLEAIGTENIRPNVKDIFICSLHFHKSAFNTTLDVIRLQDGAIPVQYHRKSSTGQGESNLKEEMKQEENIPKKTPITKKVLNFVSTLKIMKCCVSSCANNENSSPPADVAYYEIPQEFDLRQLWTEAISTPEWELRPNSAVCSAHFGEFDFVISETGDKELIYGAVPSLCLNTDEDLQAKAEFKTCRVCLAMDRKMFNIRDHNLHHLYKMIVGVTVQARDGLPQMVCWECTSKLLSLKKFKEQAQTSQLLLSDKLDVNNILTVGDIKSIDRINYNLKSSLTVKHYKYNIEVFDNPRHKHIEMLLDNNKSERDQGPTLEIDGSSPTCKIPKCAKVEPESNNLVKLMMLDLKQDIDVMDTSQPYISDELHSDKSQQAEHSDNNINTKPTRQRVKKVVPAAQRTRPKRDLNVQTNGDSAAKVPKVSSQLTCFEIRHLTPEEQQELHSVISQQAEHNYSKPVNAKPTRQRLKKVVPAAQRTRPKRDLNVQTNGYSAAKVPKVSSLLTRFEIRHLTPEEQQAAMAARARSSRYLDAPYKCDLCYKGFLSETTLAKHAVRHTEICGNYMCSLCKLRFRLKNKMRRHIEIHVTRYTCKVCGLVAHHSGTALSHQKEHDGNVYKCPHCPVILRKHTSYMSHLRMKHSSRFSCELCGYTFVSERGVRAHKNKSHVLDAQGVLEGPYCEECKLRFASDEAYQRHLTQSSVHSSDDDPCRVRNEIHYTTDKVQPRKRVNPVPCEECGEQQVSYRAYARHFRAAHPGLVRTKFRGNCMCEQCGRRFRCASLLREHMAWHEDVKRHRCDVCDKTFSTKYQLGKHRLKHGSQPLPTYPCPHCERTFTCPANRARHVKTVHERSVRFECKICGKEFTAMASMRNHIDHVHHKKPWPKRVRAPRSRSRPSTDRE